MLSRLWRGRQPDERAMQVRPWGPWSTSTQIAGVTVDSTTAVQHLAVYGCVSLIAETIAALPVDTFDAGGVNIPNPRWVEEPNSEQDRQAFVSAALVSLLLDGNAYVAAAFDGDGPAAMSLLAPSRVSLQPGRPDRPPVFAIDGRPTSLPILHLKGLCRPGMPLGMSPVEAARQAIGLGLAAQMFGAQFFAQGVSLSGVIEVPGDLTLEQAREMADMWRRDHAGLDRAHLPGVLKGGATWRATSMTAEQAQFLETRRFQAAEIAGQMFRVDPSLLGIGVEGTSLTYANLESRGTHLVQFTLLPWLVRLERFYGMLLPAGSVKFNVAGLLRADLATRYNAYATGIASGFLTPNEARAKEDLPAVADGDQPTISPTMRDARTDELAGRLDELAGRVDELAGGVDRLSSSPRHRGLRVLRAADGRVEGIDVANP